MYKLIFCPLSPFVLSVGAKHRSRRMVQNFIKHYLCGISFDFGPFGAYAQDERQRAIQQFKKNLCILGR